MLVLLCNIRSRIYESQPLAELNVKCTIKDVHNMLSVDIYVDDSCFLFPFPEINVEKYKSVVEYSRSEKRFALYSQQQ